LVKVHKFDPFCKSARTVWI